MFSMESVSQNPLIATFQLPSAASLNLGLSENGVLGNGLIWYNSVSGYWFIDKVDTEIWTCSVKFKINML